MNIKILDLTRQYDALKEEIEKAVVDQMESGIYIGGNAVVNFEKKFAKYIGVKHAIALNSGTDALIIALKTLKIGAGDEVITTPFTFFSTAEAVAMAGATPVFVDVEEGTYNIDANKIEEKITERTKAILPVHIFGQPVDMTSIVEIAQKHNLYIIEDACQAIGSSIGNRKIGSIGDLACFSFFPTKNLGAFGDGGIITTNNDDFAVVCRAYREHGGSQNGAKAKEILENRDIGNNFNTNANINNDALYNPYKYYNYLIAYNSRLDAIQARILNIKLDYLDKFNAKRTEIAEFYNTAFAEVAEIAIPQVRNGVVPVWHQYAFRCNAKNAMGEFLASKGIGSATFYPVPLHLQKAFDYLGYKEGDLPVVEKITKQTVCLPIFPELTRDELGYIVRSVKEFFQK